MSAASDRIVVERALGVGLAITGAALVGGAVQQLRTGQTQYRGLITRDGNPATFTFVLVTRLLLGPLCLALGAWLLLR